MPEVNISTSREKIREQLTELTKNYLEIQNVDFSKSHYLSYILDVLSYLSSNLLYFSSTSLHESNLLTARLDDSIRNLAQFIGYNPLPATPSNVDALFTIDLSEVISMPDFRIQMNENFQLQSENNVFRLIESTVLIERNNSAFRIILENDYGRVLVPYSFDNVTGELSFIVNFQQLDFSDYEYVIDRNLLPYQFYTIEQNVSGNISKLEIYVNDILWDNSDTVYLLSGNDQKYMTKYFPNKFVVIFGNGIFGKQPDPGATVKIRAYLTNGSAGNIIPGTLKAKDRLFLENPGGPDLLVDYDVTNVDSAHNGKDLQTNQEIKKSAINSLSSLKRLVSRLDYEAMESITSIPFDTSISYLKRSDIKTNEINTYGVLTFQNDIVPSTSFSMIVSRPNEPPKVDNVNVTGNQGDITINYDIDDDDLDSCSIRCYYSINNGLDWHYTNRITGSQQSLATPGSYSLIWHSGQDVHGHYFHTIFKIVPFDPMQVGYPGYSHEFELLNNNIPVISNLTRNGDHGDIEYNFDLYDADGDHCDIRLAYSLDGGNTWINSSNLSGFQFLSTGNHSLIWRTIDDGLRYGNVIVRIYPRDPYQEGNYVEDIFYVTNNNPPAISIVSVGQGGV